jgi:hypothetical protein
MTYIQKYSELFYSYALKHNLSEDFDDWPLENQKEFDGLYRPLRAEHEQFLRLQIENSSVSPAPDLELPRP